MPDFDAWLGTAETLNTTSTHHRRAAAAWKRIQDKPTSVTFDRNGTTLTAQTVRVEPGNGGSDMQLPPGTIAKQSVVVYGVRQHATVADTDMLQGDRFVHDGKIYEITIIVKTFGEIQGFGEVTS